MASQFSDLVQLRNDKDIEIDFFKNIVHVQVSVINFVFNQYKLDTFLLSNFYMN